MVKWSVLHRIGVRDTDDTLEAFAKVIAEIERLESAALQEWDRGYDSGHKDGEEAGHKAGYAEGYSVGTYDTHMRYAGTD